MIWVAWRVSTGRSLRIERIWIIQQKKNNSFWYKPKRVWMIYICLILNTSTLFMVRRSCFVFFISFPLTWGGRCLVKNITFFYPFLSASSLFRFQVMWFVHFVCVFLLLIFLCNLPFCLLPLHFSLLVDFAQKVDLALLVQFF